MSHHHNINYVEFPASDMAATKAFFGTVFAFPGGRRFHFTDPGGNEFAVWSE